jgi:hypothetical protein
VVPGAHLAGGQCPTVYLEEFEGKEKDGVECGYNAERFRLATPIEAPASAPAAGELESFSVAGVLVRREGSQTTQKLLLWHGNAISEAEARGKALAGMMELAPGFSLVQIASSKLTWNSPGR